MAHRAWSRHHLWIVAAAYFGVTILVCWPLVTRLTSSLAGDFGDPVFVAWVMAWVARHLTTLSGGADAWSSVWQAPIFAPEPGTLTYSDHFVAQAVQALPLYWLTGNPLLAYNVMVLAAFALTGLAAHALTYRFSASHLAGAVTGLTFAFSHYRLYWSLAHLQTLSVHWWIFGLFGLDAFAATGSVAALAGATGGIVALSLSSGYLMAFTAPFTPLFAVWSLARHGQLRNPGRWLGLACSGGAALLAVWPFVRPYLAMRDALGVTRTMPELVGNSVTLAGYWQEMPWLGPLLAMAAVAVVVAPVPGTGGLSRRARWGLLAMALAALVLALGPVIRVGHVSVPGPYEVLFAYVPGFQGLRVVHRFAVIGLLFMSVLAGIGAAWLARWQVGVAAVVVLLALATRTAWTRPFPIDVALDSPGLAHVPAYLRPSPHAPTIYRFVRTLPSDAVIVELPFGDLGYEIRYTFFTLAHQRRILNGYSGVLPESYLVRQGVLRVPLADSEASWRALAPATHVVVHTRAWLDDTGPRVREWLESRGARAAGDADGAWVYELPRR